MTDNQKVLVVDDESDFRVIMEKFFTRRQLAYASAPCCMDGLDLLARDSFDVVIMDVGMPGLDGIRCMEKIKQLHPSVEVIILTGHGSPMTGITGMKKGAFDFCLKPIDFDELMEKITLARKSIKEKR